MIKTMQENTLAPQFGTFDENNNFTLNHEIAALPETQRIILMLEKTNELNSNQQNDETVDITDKFFPVILAALGEKKPFDDIFEYDVNMLLEKLNFSYSKKFINNIVIKFILRIYTDGVDSTEILAFFKHLHDVYLQQTNPQLLIEHLASMIVMAHGFWELNLEEESTTHDDNEVNNPTPTFANFDFKNNPRVGLTIIANEKNQVILTDDLLRKICQKTSATEIKKTTACLSNEKNIRTTHDNLASNKSFNPDITTRCALESLPRLDTLHRSGKFAMQKVDGNNYTFMKMPEQKASSFILR
jgi:hypothetical protein